jgi:MFS family permease
MTVGPGAGEAAPTRASRWSWLNRNVVGLGINRFLSDFGHEAGTAILPLFLTAIGAPAFALGIIEGVSDALSSFAKLFGGWLGDKVHRRRGWAAFGYLVTGITTGLYGLFAGWPWILFVRAIGWAGRGLRSPLHDAILTDSVPAAARGRAFGFDEAADTAGAIIGPLAALAIISALAPVWGQMGAYHIGFWLAAVPGVLAALSILMLVRETPHPLLGKVTFLDTLRQLPPPFRRYLVAIFVFGCGDFSHTLLMLYAVQSLTPLLGPGAGLIAIQLYTLHNVLYAAGAFPAGALADRFGKQGFLILAYLLAILMNLLLVAAAPSVTSLIIVFALGGSAYALQQSLERAIAADMVPVEVRSTGFGVLATVNGIGDLISSVVVGLLWSAFSPQVAFAFSLTLTVIGTVGVALVLAGGANRGDGDRMSE